MLTFVLVASRTTQRLPATLLQRVRAVGDDVLLHRPEQRRELRSTDGRVLLRTWETTDPGTGWSHHRRHDGDVAAISGWSWPLDGRASGLGWLDDLARSPESMPAHLDQLAGAFTLVHASERGTATVAADRSGGGLLYLARTTDALVVGSRPEVVAAVAQERVTPLRDRRAVAWLPALGFLGDARTTFEGVEVLPVDARVEVTEGDATVVAGTPPWRSPEVPTVDEVAERLITLLTAAAAHPADEKLFLLSGGRDSRTLLAAAVEAGVADRFRLVTFGTEDHQDVVAARQVAGHLGLEVERVAPPTYELDAESFLRAAREHVGATAGAFGLWDLKSLHPSWALRVTGLGGGFLHSLNRPLTAAGDPETITDELLDAIRFDAGGFLRPEVRGELRDATRTWVEDELAAGTAPTGLADVHYADVHRRRWIGAAQEINTWGAQLAPLLDERLIRSGLAASAEDRATGVHSLEILRALRPDLARIPLANRPWSDACIARHPDLDVPAVRPPADRPVDWHDATWPLIEPVFREHLSEHANPDLHALVDVHALSSAMDRHARLDAHTKAQLWATLGAAIWLTGTDLPVSYPPRPSEDRPTERQRLLTEAARLRDAAVEAEARAAQATRELERLRGRRVVRTGLAVADSLGRTRRKLRR